MLSRRPIFLRCSIYCFRINKYGIVHPMAKNAVKKDKKNKQKRDEKVFAKVPRRMYEVALVLPTSVSEKADEGIDLLKKLLGSGGTIKETTIWGKRSLAYPIKKQSEGVYAFIHVEADPSVVKEMTPKLEQSDIVLRYIILQKNPDIKPKEEIKKE